ncbi:MAG: hemerythrin domain-containing protein [Candidatus Polarisedimenticolaceae bacterium]|nr:hemerythrin domain-containing protein [Candidatus Polarisedimenticolaceae bacterium]
MLFFESGFPQFGSFNESNNLPLIDDFGRGLLVHMVEIDTLHGEFVDLVNALGRATDETFPELFQELVTHTEGHFDFENKQMRRKRYPQVSTHRAEHDRVLGEMRQINVCVKRGEFEVARTYVAELPAWFRLHVLSMDGALSTFLTQKS